MAQISETAPALTTRVRYTGLDGMRAIAVALVVAYHLFPGWWIRSGFIGVDVFFVISGFLITTLLLAEHDRTARIGIVSFWQRRARRLLPALALMVTVCASAAWMIGGDVLVRMGAQIFGAATFSYNWVSIAGGDGYFSQTTPELFRNLWSLAVEEQFYVLWPLVLPLFLLLRSQGARAFVAFVAGVGSLALMGVFVAGGDLTRAYFGTDSHAFGILCGVALAFLMQRMLRAPRRWMTSWPVKMLTIPVGAAALGGVIAIAMLAPTEAALTFPGMIGGACALATVAVFAGAWPGSWFGRALDAPLRWIGDRSYGIYLWHWPLLVLLLAWLQGTGPELGVPLWIGALALALTLLAAVVSYRLIEQPVRRFGFRGSLRLLWSKLAGTPATRFGAIAGIAVGALVLGGTSAAIAAAPAQSSARDAVSAGIEALEAAASETPTPGPTATRLPVSPPPGPSPTATIPAAPTPSPTAVTGAEITAIGDSVMLASASGLLKRFPGIAVDATVSRSMWAGPGILQSLAASGRLRPYVVVALGTNGPINAASLAEVARIVGPSRHLVLVNAYAPRDWIAGVNADLAAFAAAHPGVAIADWSGAIGARTDLLAGDHIHPGAAGGRVFADAVAAPIAAIEAARAQRQYQVELRAYRFTNGLLDLMPQ